MRKIKTERVDGKLPSLEGHTKFCVYGVNLDGSDTLICFCETPSVEIKEEAKATVEAPVVETVNTESKVETISIDTDKDGDADVVITGDVVRGSNAHATKIDIDGDGEADTTIKGKVVSRKKAKK
mgnify:CR=1 FL=1